MACTGQRRAAIHRIPWEPFMVAVGLLLITLLVMDQQLSQPNAHQIAGKHVPSSLTRMGVDCTDRGTSATKLPEQSQPPHPKSDPDDKTSEGVKPVPECPPIRGAAEQARVLGGVDTSNTTEFNESDKTAGDNEPENGAIPEDFETLPYPYFHRQLPNAYIHSTNDSTYRDTTVGFVHNPKSAGSTIKQCMSTILRERGMKPPVLLFSKTAAGVRQDLLNEKTVMSAYYMGDSTLGICDYGPPRSCSYFTMIREPYARAVSHYYFCKDGGKSYPGCDNSTLEEFVLDICSLFFSQTTDQFNCHESEEDKCAGYPDCPKSWACNATRRHINNLSVTPAQRRSILQFVTDRLDRMFAVIGLAEEFETSLKLFQDTFGIGFYDKCRGAHSNRGTYSHKKKASKGENRASYMEGEIEAAKQRLRENKDIRQCLSEDEKIYNRAKEIFKLQLERYQEKVKQRGEP